MKNEATLIPQNRSQQASLSPGRRIREKLPRQLIGGSRDIDRYFVKIASYRQYKLLLVVILLAIALPACSRAPRNTLIGDVGVFSVAAAEGNTNPQVTTTAEATRTPVAETLPAAVEPSNLESSSGDSSPPPLHFTFPTTIPSSISAWRPPLYEVPWAPTINDHFYFSRPIAADEINWPLEDYRYGGVFFDDVVHTGVDIPAPEGTPVIAAGPGKIVKAGYGVYTGRNNPDDPYGLAVVIRHDFGYQDHQLYTVYGHLSEIDVVEGQRVETGDELGLVGHTGFTTGPHLHFEVRIGENRFLTTRNPELWIAPPLGWGVLAGRILDTNGRPAYSQLIIIRNKDTGQLWRVITYGKGPVNPDPYYQENMVIGDLPAGIYQVRVSFFGRFFEQEIQIFPGLVSYLTFEGYKGFGDPYPPTPTAEFVPPVK